MKQLKTLYQSFIEWLVQGFFLIHDTFNKRVFGVEKARKIRAIVVPVKKPDFEYLEQKLQSLWADVHSEPASIEETVKQTVPSWSAQSARAKVEMGTTEEAVEIASQKFYGEKAISSSLVKPRNIRKIAAGDTQWVK